MDLPTTFRWLLVEGLWGWQIDIYFQNKLLKNSLIWKLIFQFEYLFFIVRCKVCFMKYCCIRLLILVKFWMQSWRKTNIFLRTNAYQMFHFGRSCPRFTDISSFVFMFWISLRCFVVSISVRAAIDLDTELLIISFLNRFICRVVSGIGTINK